MYNDEMPIVNQNMKKLRIKAGLTQKQMGDVIHLDHRTISEYEKGRFEPGAGIIVQYCSFFHVSADELLGYSLEEQMETTIVPTEEELQMIDGYRRRRQFQQDAIRILCLDGAKLMNEQAEIEQEKAWIENREKRIKKNQKEKVSYEKP